MSQRKRDDRARRRPSRAWGTGPYRAAPPGGKPPGRPGRAAARWALLLVLLAFPAAAAAEAPLRATACQTPDAPEGPRLRVAVSGARRAAGNITVTLYGSQRVDFLTRGGRLARQRVPIAAGADSIEACFALSAPGGYAVAIYHDENGDHDFNRNAVGLPAEGYGFSNDAPTAFGLPDFDRVRFTLPPGGARVAVRLRY